MREATPEMRYHREREPGPLDEASHDAWLQVLQLQELMHFVIDLTILSQAFRS